MYKLILITVITLLCSSMVAQAQPLPLIPKEQAANEVTATTANTTVNTTANTNKETNQTTKKQADKTTITNTTTQETAKETTAQPSSTQNSNLTSLIENGHKKWFEIKDKTKGEIEKLSTALEGDGDYRSKAKRGHILLAGKELLGEASAFGADSIRGALDALMGWDFTHGTNK